jgi:hypothetical protein
MNFKPDNKCGNREDMTAIDSASTAQHSLTTLFLLETMLRKNASMTSLVMTPTYPMVIRAFGFKNFIGLPTLFCVSLTPRRRLLYPRQTLNHP